MSQEGLPFFHFDRFELKQASLALEPTKVARGESEVQQLELLTGSPKDNSQKEPTFEREEGAHPSTRVSQDHQQAALRAGVYHAAPPLPLNDRASPTSHSADHDEYLKPILTQPRMPGQSTSFNKVRRNHQIRQPNNIPHQTPSTSQFHSQPNILLPPQTTLPTPTSSEDFAAAGQNGILDCCPLPPNTTVTSRRSTGSRIAEDQRPGPQHVGMYQDPETGGVGVVCGNARPQISTAEQLSLGHFNGSDYGDLYEDLPPRKRQRAGTGTGTGTEWLSPSENLPLGFPRVTSNRSSRKMRPVLRPVTDRPYHEDMAQQLGLGYQAPPHDYGVFLPPPPPRLESHQTHLIPPNNHPSAVSHPPHPPPHLPLTPFQDQPSQLPPTQAPPNPQPNQRLHFPSLAAGRSEQHQRPPTWHPPLPDPTIPRTDSERRIIVQQLLSAMTDLHSAQDTGLSFQKRWTMPASQNTSFYAPQDMEIVCWELARIAERLHRAGPAHLSIFDPEAQRQNAKTRDLTFEQRVAFMCRLMRYSKARCDALIKGEAWELFVVQAKLMLQESRTNREQNENRKVIARLGREAMGRRKKKKKGGMVLGDGTGADGDGAAAGSSSAAAGLADGVESLTAHTHIQTFDTGTSNKYTLPPASPDRTSTPRKRSATKAQLDD